jgi:predicted anti-sigma-YlaC factor YlaD
MDCVDFEDLWNEVLDARLAGPSDLEQRLEEHAVSCASCRAISTRYQTLRQVVGALGPPPAPSAESSARLLALMVAAPVAARRRPIRRLVRYAWVPLATAAALLVIARPGGPSRQEPIAPSTTMVRPPSTVVSYRPLDWALADAKTASIELAREASAPAARIGREVLADRDGSGHPASVPARPVVDGLAPPPSDLIQSVGERFTASVRPISGSARHAFGFLLGPPPLPPAQKSL